MSSAPVPIVTEFILKRDRFLSDLREMNALVGAEMRRMSQTQFEIPIKVSNKLTEQFKGLGAEFTRQGGFQIPASLIDNITPAIAAIRMREEANPIRLTAIVDGVSGTAARGAAVANARIPGLGDSPVASAMRDQLTGMRDQVTQLQWRDYLMNQDDKPGFFSGMLGRRALGAAFIAYHGLNTVSNEIELGMQGQRLAGMEEPIQQGNAVKQLIEQERSGARGQVNSLYSLIGNFIREKGTDLSDDRLQQVANFRNPKTGEFTWEQRLAQFAYVPKYNDEMARIDSAEADYRRVERRGEHIDAGMRNQKTLTEQQADMEFEATHSAADQLAKAHASIDRALKKHQDASDKIVEGWQQLGFTTYQDALNYVAKLRSNAKAIHDAASKELDRAQQANLAEMESQVQQLKLRARGDSRGADLAELNQRIAQRQEQETRQSAAGGEYFRQQVAPAMRNQFLRDQARAARLQSAESTDQIASFIAAGQVADLRTGGQDRAASLLSRNTEIDERIHKMRQLAGEETDSVKRHQRLAEVDAAADAGQKEKAANIAEDRRQIEDKLFAYRQQVRQADLSDERLNFDAQKRVINEYYDFVSSRAQSAEEKTAIENVRGAQQAKLARDEMRSLAAYQRETRDIELRTAGRPQLAEVEDIQFAVKRELQEAGNDPQMQAAIRRRAVARFEDFRHPVGTSRRFGSSTDYAMNLQQSILNFDAGAYSLAGKYENQYAGAISSAMDGTHRVSDPFAALTTSKDLKDSATELKDASEGLKKVVDQFGSIAILR